MQIPFPGPPSDDQKRKELQNIVDSYSNTWDLVAELSQNAVDAIRRSPRTKSHSISLTIDNTGRTIRIRDSGNGFDPTKAAKLFEPHVTDKSDSGGKLIGQKGVGLTYVIFMCDHFQLTSASEQGHLTAVITNASSWRRGVTKTPPVLTIEHDLVGVSPSETFSEILVQNIDCGTLGRDFFDLSDKTQQLILFTKTALGSTRPLFSNDDGYSQIEITLSDGVGNSAVRPFAFIAPGSFVQKESLLSRQQVVDKLAAIDLPEQKRQYLEKKAIYVVKEKIINGRQVRAYAFYAPSKLWSEINRVEGFATAGKESGESYEYKPGIFLATRGMPTGIELTQPRVGNAGYWSGMFILIEDDGLPFDLGRKYVPPRTQGALREFAGELFVDLTQFAPYFQGAAPAAYAAIAPLNVLSKRDEFANLQALPNLTPTSLSFKKIPDRQEAAVAAIFFELCGRSLLRGYRTLRVGYKAQYDWWGLYMLTLDHIGKSHHAKISRVHKFMEIVAEFKYSAEDIVADLEDNKEFNDIDLLICWDFDEKRLSNGGFLARPLAADDALFHGSNFILESAGAKKLGASGRIAMISLRQFLQEHAREMHL